MFHQVGSHDHLIASNNVETTITSYHNVLFTRFADPETWLLQNQAVGVMYVKFETADTILAGRALCPFKCMGHGNCIQISQILGSTFLTTDPTNEVACECDDGWSGRICEQNSEGPRFVGAMLYAILLMSFFFFCPFAVVLGLRQRRRMTDRARGGEEPTGAVRPLDTYI